MIDDSVDLLIFSAQDKTFYCLNLDTHSKNKKYTIKPKRPRNPGVHCQFQIFEHYKTDSTQKGLTCIYVPGHLQNTI